MIRKDLKKQLEIVKNNKDNQLFLNNNEYVRPTSLNTVLKRIFKTQLGLDNTGVSTHSLRHTYATRSIEAAMTPVVLQRLMGHKDIKVTLNTYTSVFNKFKEDEIEKVNKYLLDNQLNVTNNFKTKEESLESEI